MNSKKQRRTAGTGLGVGVSSILVIFVLLCLVTFATLSLVSARADWTLSQKAAAHTTAAETAANTAEQTLAKADALLADCYAGAADEADYRARAKAALATLGTLREADGKLYFDFVTEVSDTQTLNASLRVLWPAAGGGFYEIARWQTVSTGAWQPDDGLPVYGAGGSSTAALPGASSGQTAALPGQN